MLSSSLPAGAFQDSACYRGPNVAEWSRRFSLKKRAEPSVREFVESDVRRRLHSTSSYRLSPTMYGLTSCVYFLDLEGHAPMVLRREDSVAAARRRLAGARLLRRHNVDVPKILMADLRWSTRRRWGGCFLLEERLPGRPYSECENVATIVDSTARLFAQLHGHRCRSLADGPSWSSCAKAVLERKQPLERKIRRSARRLLERYRQRNLPHAGDIRAVLTALPRSAWRPSLRLCHGDPAEGNILYYGNEVGLVDFSETGFHWAGFELAKILHRRLGYDEELCGRFLDAYCLHAEPPLWREIERTLRPAQILWHLQRVLHPPRSISVGEDNECLFAAIENRVPVCN